MMSAEVESRCCCNQDIMQISRVCAIFAIKAVRQSRNNVFGPKLESSAYVTLPVIFTEAPSFEGRQFRLQCLDVCRRQAFAAPIISKVAARLRLLLNGRLKRPYRTVCCAVNYFCDLVDTAGKTTRG